MKTKKWILIYVLSSIPLLALLAVLTIFVDPYFHYHKPRSDLFFYVLGSDYERYLNDGITKNFDYDSILTGTSMSENFKTSEFDAEFGCNSIKAPFRGGTIYEISDNLDKALKTHKIRFVLRSIDYYMLNIDPKERRTHFNYPDYLYNSNPVDDVKYLWNINVISAIGKCFLSCLKKQHGITRFDEYGNWMSNYTFGKSYALGGRSKFDTPLHIYEFTEEDEKRTRENIMQNIVDIAHANPETQFYCFFPPYSIVDWGVRYESGTLDIRLKTEAITARLLSECENIHLFSFNSRTDWILDLNRYKDTAHYDEKMNSEMLNLMKKEKFRITKDNVEEYLKAEKEFFTNFDYNSIF